MKHKDWPYIKGDKQIIALTKAYEYNKREADKYKSICKQKDEKIEELTIKLEKLRYESEIKNY